MMSEEPPERINWQDLPPNGNEHFDPGFIRFENGDENKFQRPFSRISHNMSDDDIREISRFIAEQVAIRERIKKQNEDVVRQSTTHTMIVMNDGEVIYNKYPDKVMPPAIFG